MLYRAIDVWRRARNGGLVRYRCFRLIPAGGYCVQSADAFDAKSTSRRLFQGESQFLELLAEEPPEMRSGVYETLDEAVIAFDREFDDVSSE